MFRHSCTDLTKLSQEKVQKWLGGIKAVVCDADGVLWHLDHALGKSVDAFNMLEKSGRASFIVTNNAALSRPDLLKKANGLGFKIDVDRILSSSHSCAHFLATKKFQKKVFIMGEKGIKYELEKAGLCCSFTDKRMDRPMVDFVKDLKLDPDVGAVVVGRDSNFNMAKVVHAGSYLLNPKVIFGHLPGRRLSHRQEPGDGRSRCHVGRDEDLYRKDATGDGQTQSLDGGQADKEGPHPAGEHADGGRYVSISSLMDLLIFLIYLLLSNSASRRTSCSPRTAASNP